MIVYPKDWKAKGQPVNIDDIEKMLLSILAGDINVNHLALSGGLDSSLMLYYMIRVFGKHRVYCHTIALSEQHPDYIFSEKVTKHFDVKWYPYTPNQIPLSQLGDYSGDEIVRCFYDYLRSLKINEIIACDGIDEYMGGYYEHQNDPTEKTYYKCIRQLQERHLEPLNENSNGVDVYLPFLDDRLISLFNQIPLADKVDTDSRKKVMVEMAKGKLPDEIIQRRKYGFSDAMKIK